MRKLIDADKLLARLEKRLCDLIAEYGNYDKYKAGFEEAMVAVEDAEVAIDELEAENAKLRKERDAAVRDIQLYPCFHCSNKGIWDICKGCGMNRSNQNPIICKYQWRGVQEEKDNEA